MSRRGTDMMGNSDGSYHWQGGTAVGGSFTNDGATKKINVTISQISGWRISDRRRRIEAQQRGQRRQWTRGSVGPGKDAPITDNDNNANDHNDAASSYRGRVGGRYKDNANYYNGNEREECKIWLSRSLKEMDFWKVWYIELREEQHRSGGDGNHNGWGALDGPRKLVRFKDKGGAEEDKCKAEGCPLSLVRSVLLSRDDDGYFGNEDNDVNHHRATLLTPSQPPPLPPLPPPHSCPADSLMSLLTTQEAAMTNRDGVARAFFSPTVAGRIASSSVHLNETEGTSLPPPMQHWGGCGGRIMRV
jgi:hypothetical protein